MISRDNLLDKDCILHWKGDVAGQVSKVVTAYGDVKQVTTIPDPFGGNTPVAYFDGTGDYLSCNTNILTSLSSFTIGVWVYITSIPSATNYRIVGQYSVEGTNRTYYAITSGGYLGYFVNGNLYNSSTLVPLNQWVYVEFDISGSTLYGFINGVLSITAPYLSPESTNTLIGTGSNITECFKGYMSEVIIKNTCLHTSNFTSPTTRFTTDSNTKLLLHLNDTGTTFTDSSGYDACAIKPMGKSVTPNGNVTQILPFAGAGVGVFDGTGDYLTVGATGDFDFGNGQWTIEGYIYINDAVSPNGCPIVVVPLNDTGGFHSLLFYLYNSGKLGCIFAANATSWIPMSYEWTTVLSLKQLYHFSLVRNSDGYIRGYLNGVQDFSFNIGTTALLASTAPLRIGQYIPSDPRYFNGNLSELRISSVARYTSNFTPPRTQLQSDSNTKLLLHFLGSGQTFVDSSPSPKSITAYGDAKQLSSPCGSGIAYFDGTGDWLTTPYSGLQLGSGNFTIRFWAKGTVNSVYQAIAGQWDPVGSNSSWAIGTGGGGDHIPYLQLYIGGAVFAYGPTAINDTNWHYYVATRNGNTYTLYIDGVSGTPVTNAGTLNQSTYSIVTIGNSNTSYSVPFLGNISDFEIKIGVAETGAVPTQPFRPDPYTKLLLHFDSWGNPTWFEDASNSSPVTVTPTGTFAIQTIPSGKQLLVFDGSTNYVSLSNHTSLYPFNSDFSIVTWFKIPLNTPYYPIYVQDNGTIYAALYLNAGASDSRIILLSDDTGSVRRFYYTYTVPGYWVLNTWYHLVVQRSGSNCLMYLNGYNLTITTGTAWNSPINLGLPITIGKQNAGYANGNIKDLQIFRQALSPSQIADLMRYTSPI